jgi:SAM-dependent methyltransferase
MSVSPPKLVHVRRKSLPLLNKTSYVKSFMMDRRAKVAAGARKLFETEERRRRGVLIRDKQQAAHNRKRLPGPLRAMARKVLRSRTVKRVRRWFLQPVPGFETYRAHLAGKRGLEIGGPSGFFADDGPLPVYRVLAGLDNCIFSPETIWEGEIKAGRTFEYQPKKEPGIQFICEATELKPIQNSTYDYILASHCLEHMANPLHALDEWKRVLKQDGVLLLVLPHKEGTFDWRRATTPLAHMIEDYRDEVGEDDLTHLPEILALHDLAKDKAAGSPGQFRQRCLENSLKRAMHHHVFDTPAALHLVDYAGFDVIRTDRIKPYHIVILSRRR